MSSHNSSGLRAWMIQRISAVYLTGFIVVVLFYLQLHPIQTWAEWRAWLAHPLVNVSSGLFFIALLLHAWVGMRDVVMDYVKPFVLRLCVLIIIGTGLMAMAIWVVRALVMVW